MQASAKIDRRFLTYLSDLLLCSRCLRSGVRTRVRQAISPRHRPRTLCRNCAAATVQASPGLKACELQS